jgi:L-serine dehydratase
VIQDLQMVFLAHARLALPLCMGAISVFDIFKVGVGPSSSHTMGPWRAAQRFARELLHALDAQSPTDLRLRIHLYGSLAKTGKGHGTDFAVTMGLCGEDPVTCDVGELATIMKTIVDARQLRLAGEGPTVPFDPRADVVFHMRETLPGHPNALTCEATWRELGGTSRELRQTYFSVGGGFIVREHEPENLGSAAVTLPHPIERASDLAAACAPLGAHTEARSVAQVMRANERVWKSDAQIDADLLAILRIMQECIFRGCNTVGMLPGGLQVTRRAARMNVQLLGIANPLEGDSLGATVPMLTPDGLDAWKAAVRRDGQSFQDILKWVSVFALAVNEENAAFGRVVTAPTNGAAGVIPAVMMYVECFLPGLKDRATREQLLIEFMLVAGQIGILFKKGATISAAMGGCQAEIGVSSAMAAAGLAHVMGASTGQVLMAAEIAMEHHLGMTCDPIGGLVQIPCIERNTMGAIKAITAANIAIESDPAQAKVSLDGVIKTMWETALDMQSKYKETSEGGLAVNISVGVSEC